ncbi:Fur family transcriptional regulator [Candidatus Neomarinimicrobiota bacterium]
MLELKEILKNQGFRYTKQRQAIWDELQSTQSYRDVEEIYVSLRTKGSIVSKASVYSTIELLVNNNLLSKLKIGDGKARFEYRESKMHYDYLICTECQKIIEFHGDEIEILQKNIAEINNFKLTHHTHQLFGLCKDCQ